MIEKNTKTFIISLIKDDLINYKLVSALEDLGLDGLDYFVGISDTVFDLMGFDTDEESDRIFELYLKKAKKVKRINIKTTRVALEALALEIYLMLQTHSPKKNAAQLAVVKQPNKILRGRSVAAA